MGKKQRIDDGVYEFDIPKTTENYARIGRTFYYSDPMHGNFLVNGQTPAFPDKEDVPRNAGSSFDSYYISINGPDGIKVHRITLTRANIAVASQERSCYVDGNLIFSACAVGKRKRVKICLYNAKEWRSGAKKNYLPYIWFYIDGVKITAISNFYMNKHVSLWASPLFKTPDHYGIFVGDPAVSITTGNLLDDESKSRFSYWPSTIYIVLLWPIYVVWLLLLYLYIPCQYFGSKCVVRDYIVDWDAEKGKWSKTSANKDLLIQSSLQE